jgi:hypothetical protein
MGCRMERGRSIQLPIAVRPALPVLGSRAIASLPDTIPAVLCIDVEPERIHEGTPRRPAGFEQLVHMSPLIRGALSTMTGAPAGLVWCIRMDPNIAQVYGEADWFATTYREVFDAFVQEGDELGVHPHNWRWDGQWIADHDDDAWVAHCADVGLETFGQAFGTACRVYRHGDGYMSDLLLSQIERAGVTVDLTLEPGRRALPGLHEQEPSRGWIPDTTGVPVHAYRPARGDFRVADSSRDDAPLFLPLTPGPVTRIGVSGARPVHNGSYPTLVLWCDPSDFVAQLMLHLSRDDVSHLAFGIHSQAGADPDVMYAILQNLTQVCAALPNRLRWCTATAAATLAEANARGLPVLP